MTIWYVGYSFGTFFPVLVSWTNKNLATLIGRCRNAPWHIFRVNMYIGRPWLRISIIHIFKHIVSGATLQCRLPKCRLRKRQKILTCRIYLVLSWQPPAGAGCPALVLGDSHVIVLARKGKLVMSTFFDGDKREVDILRVGNLSVDIET
jgi:hypothetical protein